ncbi:MAG: zinc-ribbon domain-containing protein, partial [Butyrivibrio sp.]|nr:zinc-ribbon domain-containing protein [Butyrivibrio sp.]
MICSNCNTMNADGVKFCGNCGAPLGSAQPGPQTQQGGMQYRQPPQQAQGQPQMQPGYGPQMQPGYAPPAGNNNKGGGGLKIALIAVCSLLAVAVVVLALVLTGVIGGDKSGSGKSDVVSSNKTSTRPGRNKSGNSGTGDTGGQTDAVTLYDVTIESHAQTFTLTMADGEETTVFEATYDTLSVPDASPELQRQLDALGDTDARGIRDVLSDQAEYMYEALIEEAYAVFPWQETTKLIVERADSEIFSVVADGYTYSGGVHGVGGY